MQLRDFECPNCGASEMEMVGDGRLQCLFCSSDFGEAARICPQCGHYNERGVRHCAQCGTRLLRDCAACGADNWILAEHCVQCGRNMDLIERMALRWQRTTQQRLQEQQVSMAALKEQEELASQERMAPLMEAERIRQEALALARESRRRQDRQLYLLAVAGIVVILIIVVVALLATSGRG